MNFIALTLRYPKADPENLIYICPDAILAFGPNMTDRGVIGSVVYTEHTNAFHVAETPGIILKLIHHEQEEPQHTQF